MLCEVSTVELPRAIADLDLTLVGRKVQQDQEWDEEQLGQAIKDYQRYLYLLKRYPNRPLCPSDDIDQMWHQHILFTVKYAKDCQNIFGYFQHHHPYFGLARADKATVARNVRLTISLFEKEFGEAPSNYKILNHDLDDVYQEICDGDCGSGAVDLSK